MRSWTTEDTAIHQIPFRAFGIRTIHRNGVLHQLSARRKRHPYRFRYAHDVCVRNDRRFRPAHADRRIDHRKVNL